MVLEARPNRTPSDTGVVDTPKAQRRDHRNRQEHRYVYSSSSDCAQDVVTPPSSPYPLQLELTRDSLPRHSSTFWLFSPFGGLWRSIAISARAQSMQVYGKNRLSRRMLNSAASSSRAS